MNDVIQKKKALRLFWRSHPLLSNQAYQKFSTLICDRLRSSHEFNAAKRIAIFSPQAWEPTLLELWKDFPTKCVFPKVDRIGNQINFFEISELKQLCSGYGKIEEPAFGTLVTDWKASDLILVPALAFDRLGNRLGSGKGFYDKFLSGIPSLRWGIHFSHRISETNFPTQSFDQRMAKLITETESIRTIEN